MFILPLLYLRALPVGRACNGAQVKKKATPTVRNYSENDRRFPYTVVPSPRAALRSTETA
jgi:hypothetical protein